MAYAEIFKNNDGTKTGYYSDNAGARSVAYNMAVTTGDKIYCTGYTVTVTKVQKVRIVAKYELDNGIKYLEAFAPREFYKMYFLNTYGVKGSYKPHTVME